MFCKCSIVLDGTRSKSKKQKHCSIHRDEIDTHFMGQYCRVFCDKYSTSFYLSDKSIAMIHRKSSSQKWFWLKQSYLKREEKHFGAISNWYVCFHLFHTFFSHRIIVCFWEKEESWDIFYDITNLFGVICFSVKNLKLTLL